MDPGTWDLGPGGGWGRGGGWTTSRDRLDSSMRVDDEEPLTSGGDGRVQVSDLSGCNDANSSR